MLIYSYNKKACGIGRLKIQKKKNLLCSRNVWKNTASVQAVKYLLVAPTGQDKTRPASPTGAGPSSWSVGKSPGPHLKSSVETDHSHEWW
jgi:hypothetical protein